MLFYIFLSLVSFPFLYFFFSAYPESIRPSLKKRFNFLLENYCFLSSRLEDQVRLTQSLL